MIASLTRWVGENQETWAFGICVVASLALLIPTTKIRRPKPADPDFHLTLEPAGEMTTPELVTLLRLSGAMPKSVQLSRGEFNAFRELMGSAFRHFRIVE